MSQNEGAAHLVYGASTREWLDQGFFELGFIAYANWLSANPYSVFHESMTHAEYEALCGQELSDLMDAVAP